MDSPISGDESVAWNALLRHPKIRCAVSNKLVRLFKRAFIEKEVDALPGRKLAGLALTFAPLRPTTLFGNGMTRLKLCEVALMGINLRFKLDSLRNGTPRQ